MVSWGWFNLRKWHSTLRTVVWKIASSELSEDCKGVKKLQQVLCTEKLERDETLRELFKMWNSILEELKSMITIQIPRCYFSQDSSIIKVQFHTFSNAYEKAYLAVLYMPTVARIVKSKQNSHKQDKTSANQESDISLPGIAWAYNSSKTCVYCCKPANAEDQPSGSWVDKKEPCFTKR